MNVWTMQSWIYRIGNTRYAFEHALVKPIRNLESTWESTICLWKAPHILWWTRLGPFSIMQKEQLILSTSSENNERYKVNHENKIVGNNFPTQHRHNVSTFQLPKGQVPAYSIQALNLKTWIGRIADPVICTFKNTYTNVLPIFKNNSCWNLECSIYLMLRSEPNFRMCKYDMYVKICDL